MTGRSRPIRDIRGTPHGARLESSFPSNRFPQAGKAAVPRRLTPDSGQRLCYAVCGHRRSGYQQAGYCALAVAETYL